MTDIEDETAITEITIQPDGRIYVFGLSLEVAQVLAELCPPGHAIERLVAKFETPTADEKPVGLTESER
ncbi:MAG TPA: hypothetical protein VHY91_14135 [Pirellulales bacterium]|jgi:hypothetical protein|nr:hypothetical protein [Pirellulales bacterium]